MKVSDFVIDYIAEELGLTHIFMLPGGGCMHLVDSVGRNKKIKPVCCLHEQAAAIAADGYAQYKNNIGVALVTTGPGGTNAITGVAASWIDSVPVLIISGQVKRSDLMKNRGVRQIGVQEVDIVSIVKPITKYAVTVMEPEEIKYYLDKAIHIAKNGRPGPVWIDIPLDVQGAKIEGKLKGFNPEEEFSSKMKEGNNVITPSRHCEASVGYRSNLFFEIATGTSCPRKDNYKKVDEKVKQTIELLNNSKRPVILAGCGIRIANALEQFHQLIDILGIPVLTTWRFADGMEDAHPLFFGRPGSIASRYANFIQQNSDFILVIGARLDLSQVGYNYKNFAKHAKKVIVDIDENEIKKIDTVIDVPIVADAREFLNCMLAMKEMLKQPYRSQWIRQCEEWKRKYPIILKEYYKSQKFVNTYVFIDILSDLLTSNDNIVPDSSGSASEITYQAFRIKKGQRLINSPGLGSMGFGIPQSIGVCLASGRRTICITGDGAMQHNIQELETIKRLNLPIKIFVLNNNGYSAIRNTHRRFFEGRLVCCDPSSGLTLPDTLKIGKAYGFKTYRIKKQDSLKEQIKEILESEGPVICELMIDPDLQIAPRIMSKTLPDGSMVSGSLEDMWPFLESKEKIL
ncbi:thiamine pyrophosphate-binding protein [Thermodesulfovibrio hydrogeniphilus]